MKWTGMTAKWAIAAVLGASILAPVAAFAQGRGHGNSNWNGNAPKQNGRHDNGNWNKDKNKRNARDDHNNRRDDDWRRNDNWRRDEERRREEQWRRESEWRREEERRREAERRRQDEWRREQERRRYDNNRYDNGYYGGGYGYDGHRQNQRNEWKSIATIAGLIAVIGLLNDDPTLTFVGSAGALYSLYRYDQDLRSSDRECRLRAQYFSQPDFYRDGAHYTRRTVTKNGQKYYQFCRD